ncbi:MAG: ABC transporter permease [Mesonia hippocampi]|uniref:ABC-2 type transport system permease protein n=1 Tax=Mesonia hippocampi TaxID=1628250 RepID=A0A840EX93_9FLAO|nr:ABC transporter permease [Mesonia hippocampi]MBB4118684.1 ABC-2 type transport system permease protein [Mesonia hippocampi]
MKNFIALINREFRLFWNNSVLRLLFIGAPIMYGILLGFVYQKGKVTDLPIVVVDEDQSQMSKKAVEMMQDNEVLNVAYLQYDQNKLTQIVAENDNIPAIVIIPKDFEKQIMTKKYPEILTIVNTSNVLTANYASTAIQICLGTLKAGVQIESLKKQGMPESIALTQYEPFKTTFIKKYNRSTNYMYFLWPGILATVLQQVLLLGLALSFASEYENGTFKTLITQNPSILKIMAVKIIPYLLMSFGIWLLYYLFTIWFRIPFYENLGALTLIAGVFVASVSFIGILVSILIPSQLKATEILMVIATPSFILSGFTWPLSQMPEWVVAIANVIPLTHFLKAFRVLLIEEGSLAQSMPAVWAMVWIGVVCALLSYIALFFKKKKILKATNN